MERGQAALEQGLAAGRERTTRERPDRPNPELVPHESHSPDDFMGRGGGDRSDRPDDDHEEPNGGQSSGGLAAPPQLASEPSVAAMKDTRKDDRQEERRAQGPDDVEREADRTGK